MLHKALLRELYLRQKHWPAAHIVLRRIDVKGAYRRIPVDSEGASLFRDRGETLAVLDIRLKFGRRSSPVVLELF